MTLHSLLEMDVLTEDKGAVCAIGAFDGPHLGHAQVIGEARRLAERLGAPLGVITFAPHPRRLFAPDAPPFRLASPNQQAEVLQSWGVERLYRLPFTAALAALSPEAFAEDVLNRRLGVKGVVCGADFTFGKGRGGSAETLAALGETFGFVTAIVPPHLGADGVKLSSTAIREALRAGDPKAAAAILGRPFALTGEVQHGDKRGRLLGFPTANIPLGDYIRPKFGVYATRTTLSDGRIVDGVANLGDRPTVGGTEARLEVNLFDFAEDLYGQTLTTALIAFLRPEQKFSGLEALTAQIALDAAAARASLRA